MGGRQWRRSGKVGEAEGVRDKKDREQWRVRTGTAGWSERNGVDVVMELQDSRRDKKGA